MQIHSIFHSSDKAEISALNRQLITATEEIRIIELSTLSDLVPLEDAEVVRRELLRHGVRVKQLTNLQSFNAWTKVPNFITQCMDVRYMPRSILPINVEVVMFNDHVAIYQVESDVSVTVIRNADFASQQKALFDAVWKDAEKLTLKDDGSTV